MAQVLEELSSAVAELAGRLGPSVVGVGRGGSGLVVGEGQVVTNAHNLRDGEVTVTFADGRRATGTVVAADLHGDLAVVSADTAGAPVAPFAEAGPAVGSVVVALANPGGRGVRASVGTVSAVDVGFRGPGGRRVTGALEHTAPLVRGSSGGPVVDARGAVVGIDTHRAGEGAYLAIVADAALRDRIDALGRGEAPPRPRLGIAVAPSHVARRLRAAVGLPERDGVLVHAVEEGGPADRAGVRQGDLLVTIGDRTVSDVDSLAAAVQGAAGTTVEAHVVRGAEELIIAVEVPAG
jgi:S1-C subfamily serine protease